MRISDWSSDVCSSDLSTITPHTIMPTPKHALSYVRACGRTEKNRRMRPIGWPKKWRPEKGDSSIGRILENTAWLLGGKGVGALLSFRSEEHKSELQSLLRIPYAVFGLRNKNTNKHN